MARLPQQYVDDLVAATDIVGIISASIPLKKSGIEYVGKCPFHADSTPSFSVSPQKGVFLCRGCGATGNAIKFIQDYEGTGFRDIIDRLAKENNMPVPTGSNEDNLIFKQQNEIFSLLDRAQKLYVEELYKSKEAMEYLKARGVDDDTIKRFGIGFAPGGGKFLQEKMPDISVGLLKKAGLVKESEFENSGLQDWMRYRVTFPIRNSNGKLIAFGGRILKENTKAKKYLNTPETMVFKKGNEMFGFYEASSQMRKRGRAIITEGYMDSVVPSGHGVQNIASAMGTSLSSVAIDRLFRTAEEVVFCFDPDEAGRRAARKALENAAPMIDARHSVKFAFLPEGVDPDEFVLEHGAEKFESEIIGKALPMSKYIIAEFTARNDMKTAEGRARFAVDAMDIVNRIGDPMLVAILGEEIKAIAGAGVPVPGVNAPAEPIEPPQEPVRRRGFANLRPKAVSQATAGEAFNDKQAPIPVPEPAKEDLEYKSTNIVSIFLKDPALAAYFEAEWLLLSNAEDDEIDAVDAMIKIVNDHNAAHNADKTNPMKPEAFAAALNASPTLAPYAARGHAHNKNKEGCDIQKEFSDIVAHLSMKQARLNKIKVKTVPRP